MKTTVAASVVGALLLAVATAGAAAHPKKPTIESAIAAEQELARALLSNDADAVGRLLDDDWTVVNTAGGIGNRIRTDFLSGIKSGGFTREKMDLSEVNARIYGTVAVVTSKLATSGQLMGKSFDIQERQTDVLIWRQGTWKSVLLHETKISKS
jgi:ketosteroid isomerase-like protein